MAYREPEFLPWDGVRVPLTFVGGYLGAGKTTAINAVLAASDRPIALIVNDVGSVNIDARLVRKRSGDTIELTDGCVCCSAIDGFGAAFDQIRAREQPPVHVLVELSGVAEPANVLPWGHSAGFVLDGVVTVVAVDQLLDGSLPDWVRAHLDAQIAAADLLVVTKSDLATRDDIEAAMARLHHLAPEIPVVDGSKGRGGPDALGRFLSLGGHRVRDVTAVPGPTLFDLHRTTTIPIVGPLDDDGIERLVASLPDEVDGTIARAKGIVESPEGDRRLVQVVGRRCEIIRLFPSEDQPPTDLIVITVPPPT